MCCVYPWFQGSSTSWGQWSRWQSRQHFWKYYQQSPRPFWDQSLWEALTWSMQSMYHPGQVAEHLGALWLQQRPEAGKIRGWVFIMQFFLSDWRPDKGMFYLEMSFHTILKRIWWVIFITMYTFDNQILIHVVHFFKGVLCNMEGTNHIWWVKF